MRLWTALWALLLIGVAGARDAALHDYLKGADVPLIGLMELHSDLSDDTISLLKVARDPKQNPDLAGRRARWQAMVAKNARMGKLIEERPAPPTGKELKLSLVRAHNRTAEALTAMQKALEHLEGRRSEPGLERLLAAVDAQRLEVEQAAALYQRLAVKALVK